MSTFRADVVAGIVSRANAYRTANPTRLRRVYTARPSAFAELPAAYVGERAETLAIDAGTMRREILTSLVVVDTLVQNEQTEDRLDIAVDGLLSLLASDANAHLSGGILEPIAVQDADLDVAGPEQVIHYRSSLIGLRARIQEGNV